MSELYVRSEGNPYVANDERYYEADDCDIVEYLENLTAAQFGRLIAKVKPVPAVHEVHRLLKAIKQKPLPRLTQIDAWSVNMCRQAHEYALSVQAEKSYVTPHFLRPPKSLDSKGSNV